MREREIGLVEDKIVVGQDIDVKRAWSPALLMGTVPPEGALDRLRARQQRVRGERGVDGNTQVHERRLVFDAPWWGQIVGGAGEKTNVASLAQHRDRARKRC